MFYWLLLFRWLRIENVNLSFWTTAVSCRRCPVWGDLWHWWPLQPRRVSLPHQAQANVWNIPPEHQHSYSLGLGNMPKSSDSDRSEMKNGIFIVCKIFGCHFKYYLTSFFIAFMEDSQTLASLTLSEPSIHFQMTDSNQSQSLPFWSLYKGPPVPARTQD